MKLRVALASDGEYVAGHFGHAPFYTIVNVVDGEVGSREQVPNPGHQPGFLPKFMAGLGITHIIAGGMGGRAQELFVAHNIEPVVGVQGPINDVVQSFVAGTLKTGPSLCSHGQDGHSGGACGGHHGC